jgi:uncharacterized protein with HEPN domain
MKGKIGDKQRLQHILESIVEIESYILDKDFDEFSSNSMMHFATIKQIEIIGEAANNMSEETKNNHTHILWRQIIGLRNVLVHEYFEVDIMLIWQIIQHDIPTLKNGVQLILTKTD